MINTLEIELIESEVKNRVRNFRRLGDRQWKWSCSICGDSKRDLRKARFFVGEQDNTLMCYCHNCNWSGSFAKYTEYDHPDLYQRLQHSKFVQSEHTLFSYDDIINQTEDEVLTELFFIRQNKSTQTWLNTLKDKKIFVSKQSFTKLHDIHKRTHTL